MKMKLQDAVFLYETLNEIAEMETLVDAPIEIKFTLVRNARATQPFHSEYIEQRRELLLANSSPAENSEESGDRIATAGQVQIINTELEKLGQLEIDVPVIPIKLKDLESLKLNMIGLSGLYPIITDGEV